ncbi:MAG TPA: hypothetical protein VFR14_09205, partial [Candidatus Limnocylindrales bacterium]|nr:hypothetical protein [Candidatus Limnocylindrales bacterium]
ANLLVALRERPTLRHFDPEVLSFWVAKEGRGRVAGFSRDDAVPAQLAVSWGSVRVIDRLAVENRFLTFGGMLRAAAIDRATTVVALRSPGPIVRWGGHSQGADPLAGEIGAFFGRLMVPVDFEPGAEAALAATPPAVLYAAFVRHARRRLAASAAFRRTEPRLERWLTGEATRLSGTDPVGWSAAPPLLQELGLDGT